MATFDSEFLYANSPIAGGVADSVPGETLFLTSGGGGGGGGGPTFVMRGFDANLAGAQVFWRATSIDATAAQYGGVGPVTSVVVSNIIGA